MLTQLIDRLTLHRFGETREPYMLVQDVTDWHRKELAETNGRSGDIAIIQVLEDALRTHESAAKEARR